MKLGRYEVNLARTAKPDATGTERGSSATSEQQMMFKGELDVSYDKLKPQHFVRMRQEDGTVSAMYNVITMPIQANPWHIEGEDDSADAKAQAEFVKDCLTLPPHKGGMTTSFQLVLKDMLRATLEGFRIYEKVWTIRDGKFVYQKIAPRDTRTVVILTDPNGGFNGFKQSLVRNDRSMEVTIPREYAFLFTYGKEWRPLLGESAFRSAYYHYNKKHKLYYLADQGVQVGNVATRVVKAPTNATQEQLDEYVDVASELGVNSALGLENGWELEAFDGTRGRIDPMPLIEHHDTQMARSILAQFMMLGAGQNSSGSWALSNDQTDMFILALKAVMSDLEEHINNYIIPDLIEYNFASPKYPRFEFDNITDATVDFLKETFKALLGKAPETIPSELLQGINEKVANHFDIDLNTKKNATDTGVSGLPINQEGMAQATAFEIQKQALNGSQIDSLVAIVDAVVSGVMPPATAVATIKSAFPTMDEASINGIVDPVKNFRAEITNPTTGQVKNSRVGKFMQELHRNTKLSTLPWRRALTAAEERVNLAAVKAKIESMEGKLTNESKVLFANLADQVKTDLSKLLQGGKIDNLADYQVEAPDGYEKLVLDSMVEAYDYAKVGASDELKVKTPATPASSKELVKQKAHDVVKKQMDDLTFEIKNKVTEAARKNLLSVSVQKLSLTDVLIDVSNVINLFGEDKLGLSSSIIIASAINMGRDDVFSANEDEIDSYQYSAIMDDSTCPECEDLDGSVVSPEEYASTDYIPPIHFNCRCIWIAIRSDEQNKPAITGLPKDPGNVEASADSSLSEQARELKELEDRTAVLEQAFKLSFGKKIIEEITESD